MLILSGHVSRGCWFWYVYKICTFIFGCVNRTPILLQLFSASVWFQCIFMSYHSTGWVILDVMGLFWHVASLQPEVPATSISSPVVLQVTTLLLKVAGVAHVADTTSAGYTKSVLISTFRLLTLWTLPSIGPHGEAVAMAWVYCCALQRGWKSPATWYDIERMSHCLGKG